MTASPRLTASGQFLHPCHVCGKAGRFGSGVSLLKGRLGEWSCAAHRITAQNVERLPDPTAKPKPTPVHPAETGQRGLF